VAAEGIYPVGGSGGIFPRKLFKFQVLGNAISAILRRSQGVLIYPFLKLKIPFFFILKYSKLRKSMQIFILHFLLFQFCVSSKPGSTRIILRGDIFPQKAEPQHGKCFIEKQRFNLVMDVLHLRFASF